jgi:hypothetical protein
MAEIILNEREWVEAALKRPFLGRHPIETLNRIAKYYNEEGYKKNKIGELLGYYILRCDPDASLVKWQSAIDSCVKYANKRKLIVIDGVGVTKDELTKVEEVSSVRQRRVLFTLLCMAKYGNAVNKDNNNWVNREQKEIFSMANVKVGSRNQSLMINELWRAGYLGYSKVVDNLNLNVKFVNDDSEQVVYVTDFRNLGYQYSRLSDDKYIECQNCGLVIPRASNRQIYCGACAVEMNRRDSLERYNLANNM